METINHAIVVDENPQVYPPEKLRLNQWGLKR